MIYVHVPFCRSFCTYCGFYSEICSRTESQQVQNRVFSDYTDAFLAEIQSRGISPEYMGLEGDYVPSLYIGGGTPSVLPLEMLERIVRALGQADYEEFTIEVNPDDIVRKGPDYVRGLKELGVNRVSMGVQSFDDGILKWMNRRHDAAEAREAFRILRDCGMENISIDLIFGLSHLSDSQWKETIAEAMSLGPEHISAYQLSIEEGSALERLVREGRYEEASDEQCRSQYEVLCGMLGSAGYRHYEVSNWAKPGHEAVHNSAYWRRVSYIGLGPGAHSFDAESGIRSWNSEELASRDADGHLKSWSSGQEKLTEDEAAEERIMLALRTADGIRPEDLHHCRKLLGHDDTLVEEMLEEGLLVQIGDHLRIPEDRFFVSDDIISRLI